MTDSHEAAPDQDDALIELLARLQKRAYAFVTPTPATHRLVRERSVARSDHILRDALGWSRPFQREQMPSDVLELMQSAGILLEDERFVRSALRVSSVEGRLFLHSAPTQANDAVFLGPDSYRYARLLRQMVGEPFNVRCALDVGTGSGVGALQVKALAPHAEVYASDVNVRALRLAAINARHAGLTINPVLASGLPADPRRFDLIVANPPFISGDAGKTYRDGGGDYGAALAIDWVRASVGRLQPGGRFILYTGAAVIDGRDVVRDQLSIVCAEQNLGLDYEEIDPDIFGGTLRQSSYQSVERIAAVAAVITEP